MSKCLISLRNDLCTENFLMKSVLTFFHYRLNNKTDIDFEKIEKKLWKYRETALSMQPEDVEDYKTVLRTAKVYLTKRRIFNHG